MSHPEEQQEERDVLASIFPDELTDISESSYSILIKLDLPALLSGGDEDEEPRTWTDNPDHYSSPTHITQTILNPQFHPLLDSRKDQPHT